MLNQVTPDDAVVARRRGRVVAEWGRALRGLPRNPLVRRELCGWRHRGRDWRLWIGLRLPRELQEWGLPAIVRFAMAPYVVWVGVAALSRVVPRFPSIDTAALFVPVIVALVLYTCLIAVMATATAVLGERQQATWEVLLVTPLSAAELTLGCLVGRIAPIVCGVLVAILRWVVAQPHCVALLGGGREWALQPHDTALFGAAILVRLVTLGAMGIAVSARARHTRSATAVAVALALLLLFADAVVMGGLVALSRWDGGGDGISPFAVCAPFFLAGSAIVTAAALELARRDIRRVD